MRFIPVLLLSALFISNNLAGQDTLPGFSAIIKSNGKVLISWHNRFEVVNQISIQRSYDSLRNFTTLLTVPSPSVRENGVVDNKQPNPRMYYRLFIVLENGSYIFSRSKRPSHEGEIPVAAAEEQVKDLTRVDNQRIHYMQDNSNKQRAGVTGPSKINEAPKVEIEKIFYIKVKDSLIGQFGGKVFLRFRDSILNKTKDSLVFSNSDTVLIKPFVPKEVYKISSYVFASKDGNITIALPDAPSKKYNVKFMEQDNTPVLEVKEIKDPILIIDKTNFIHAGWFRFELYEEGKLKEKNKLFIPKDF